ncbi:TetR/AcrR family transcriptional regulator [Glycomyces sp. MUSA5-2]|uniref:TetR/AcrR family transcriptional regulator n=1 Tax=Glycomyces sp. MUSA5-2 TaxID=2053002 RepID=UPI00300ADACF
MTHDRPATAPQPEHERAERILDAARELLTAWGYKRVTVDEIARRARIGKGTVYLHWKTKEQLFTALLRRELRRHVHTVAAGIERDPDAARPSRVAREVFAEQARAPIHRAMLAGDDELLGALAVSGTGLPVIRELGFGELLARLVEIWRAHGLLAETIPAADQVFIIDMALHGAVTGGVVTGLDNSDYPTEHRADLLAHTIRTALEPAGPPNPARLRAAAQAVLTALEDARHTLDAPEQHPVDR